MYKIDRCAKSGHSIYDGAHQKVCRTCDMHRTRSRFANSDTYRTWHKKWAANRYQSLKEIIVRAKAKPCMDCHVQYNHWVMTFDHRNRKIKKFTIGQKGRMQSIDRLNSEIKKCDVVCSNCHAERTHKLGTWKKALAGQKRNKCQS